jgi:hypothetical protein
VTRSSAYRNLEGKKVMERNSGAETTIHIGCSGTFSSFCNYATRFKSLKCIMLKSQPTTEKIV